MNVKSGFSLIEILVALLAGALVSLMSYEYFKDTSAIKNKITAKIDLDASQMIAINTLRLDLIQSVSYQMKDMNGRITNSVFMGNNSENIMKFVAMTTNDHSNNFSNLRRVIYQLENNNLVRTTTLANNENFIIDKRILLSDLSNIDITFGNTLNQNFSQWPSSNNTLSTYPKFIFLRFEYNDQESTLILSNFRQ
jgi:type II secretion system protein J|tara:strand:- start:26111 stop:26695 length:585 start_codon:yes stop_codon:yes gene_type:complete